jgi:hypothetical protein
VTYHVVFDISERFPEAAIGVIALVAALTVLALALIPRTRRVARTTSWLWMAGAGLLWGAFQILNVGIPYGLLFSAPSVIAIALALYAAVSRNLTATDGSRITARSAALIVAPVLLLITALVGCQQLSAFDLAHRLATGDVTVVTGTVQDFTPSRQGWGGGPKGPECFTVSGHTYCYNIWTVSSETIGFHWITDNGGPMRDGLQVRVSSIGDVIVRLESAVGQ